MEFFACLHPLIFGDFEILGLGPELNTDRSVTIDQHFTLFIVVHFSF